MLKRKTMFFSRRITGGFILLEVMFAIILLSVGLLSVVKSFSVSLTARQYSRHYSQAAFLADRILNMLEYHKHFEEQRGEERIENTTFHWLTGLDLSPNRNMKKVKVTVVWQERSKKCQIELSTLFPRVERE